MLLPSATIALGYHDQSSPRHQSVCDVLKKEGYAIIECHTAVRGLFSKYRDLWKTYRKFSILHSQFLILVPFPGHYIVPLAWLLSRWPRRRLLFDAFISLYDTNVCDRRRVPRWHPRAWLWYAVDFVSCHLADGVLIDTEEHKKYFVKTFFLRPEKVRVIYLQARSDLFFSEARNPKHKIRNSFEVLFYGSYIPLHGIEHILHAAALLQDRSPQIHFTIVGSGQEEPAMHALARELHLRNVTFLPFVPLPQLPSLIHSADLCLCIFGTSSK
ncbi:glycosyltransferase family 4 protein, partial [Candidatus Peregrinibacteria bacterium]|nr:glycosyltransferase family 4 protein [Candidatus Peregrinibacteria bacterium]